MLKKVFCTRRIALIVFAAMLLGIMSVTSVPFEVRGQTGDHYVDPGSTEDPNNRDGSYTHPWKTAAEINGHDFNPGDRILFMRGTVFGTNEQILLGQEDSGSSSAPLVIDAYGDPNLDMPVITDTNPDPNYYSYAFYLVNIDFCEMKNLEIDNFDEGVYACYDTAGHNGLQLKDMKFNSTNYAFMLDALDPNGFALDTSGYGYAVNNIAFENNEVQNCTYGIRLRAMNIDLPGTWYDEPETLKNVTIKNNRFSDSELQMVLLCGVEGATIVDNYFNGMSVAVGLGTTGIHSVNSRNLIFKNNVVKNLFYSGDYDQSLVDLDGFSVESEFYGNYFAGAAGGAVELMVNDHDASPRYNYGHKFFGNVFVQNTQFPDSYSHSSTYGACLNQVFWGGPPYDPNFTGDAYDNLWNDRYGFTKNGYPYVDFRLWNSGTGITSSHNSNIGSIAYIYNAANDFTNSQGVKGWTYQYKAAGSSIWDNISDIGGYDDLKEKYYGNDGSEYYLSRFNFKSSDNTGAWVRKAWTAPRSGTVEIRGYVCKNATDSAGDVKIKITQGEAKIWPGGTDNYRIITDDPNSEQYIVLTRTVSAGDKIGFEASAGASSPDLISWSPSIAYTSFSGSGPDNLAKQVSYLRRSSVYPHKFYDELKVIDGDKRINPVSWEGWCNNTGDSSPWIRLCFNNAINFDQIKVYLEPGDEITNYEVYTTTDIPDDSANWVQKAVVDNSFSLDDVITSSISGASNVKGVEFRVTGTMYGYARIKEIELYNTAALLPETGSIDNGDTGYTTTAGFTYFQGVGYLNDVDYAYSGTGALSATWTPSLAAGNYKVYARWEEYPNRATNAPYIINYSDGNMAVPVNQELNPDPEGDDGGWYLLGVYYFNGSGGDVKLTDNANEFVIADAVKFVAVTPADLFTDGFESGLGGWTGSGCEASTQFAKAGSYAARFDSSDSLTKAFSTSGKRNLQVSFWWRTYQCETGDSFVCEWYDGSTWQPLKTFTINPTSFQEVTLSLPAGANNNPNFQLRFKTQGNGAGDYAYLDDVKIMCTN